MKFIFIAVCFIFLPILSFAKSVLDYRENIPVYSLNHEFRDTIDFRGRMSQNDRKFIIYCANWCKPSYKELNILYSQGIIDKLKEQKFHLIVVADKSPCLNLNHFLIEGDWKETFMQDFEIYYDIDGSFLNKISSQQVFPYCMIMNKSEILIESIGLKEDYSFIIDCISNL